MTIDLKNNKFYAVSLLFKSLLDGEFLEENLWEESIVLIEATGMDEAKNKAITYALLQENSYESIAGNLIIWKFFSIERVYEIDEFPLANGVELFSRFLRNSEVKSILESFDD